MNKTEKAFYRALTEVVVEDVKKFTLEEWNSKDKDQIINKAITDFAVQWDKYKTVVTPQILTSDPEYKECVALVEVRVKKYL